MCSVWVCAAARVLFTLILCIECIVLCRQTKSIRYDQGMEYCPGSKYAPPVYQLIKRNNTDNFAQWTSFAHLFSLWLRAISLIAQAKTTLCALIVHCVQSEWGICLHRRIIDNGHRFRIGLDSPDLSNLYKYFVEKCNLEDFRKTFMPLLLENNII